MSMKVVCKKCEKGKFKVITLCGSTKFKHLFEQENKRLTLLGNLVISVGVFGHIEGINFTKEAKQMLDDIHKQKIDLADEVRIISADNYIGSSTKNEIEYAKSIGKEISYFNVNYCKENKYEGL